MRRALLPLALVLLILGPSAAVAQRQNSEWYFGLHAGVTFNIGTTAFYGGRTDQLEGTSSACDPVTGLMLFYTDGSTVWNRNNIVMANGRGLLGNGSSTHSALVVPTPGNAQRYYIFTADAQENNYAGGINYSVVDLQADSGRGDVVQKNVPVLRPAAEKLAAVRSCLGDAYWVIMHGAPNTDHGNDTFYVCRVGAAGVSPPVPWKIGSLASTSVSGVGQLKASPDGTMLAYVQYDPAALDILRFDRSSGAITESIHVKLPELPFTFLYGASFSPDDSKLYVSLWDSPGIDATSYLYQYDLSTRTKSAIDASRMLIASKKGFMGSHQLGVDGRIYLTTYGAGALDLIDKPNLRGAACNYRSGSLMLGFATFAYWGLPSFVDTKPSRLLDSLTAAPDTTICYGGATTLRASGGVRYSWSPAIGLSCTECPTPIASPPATTTYRVEAFNETGCSKVDSITVFVHDRVLVDAGADTAICSGSAVRLNAAGGANHRWSPAEGLSCTSCTDPIAAPSQTTDYVVTVTSANGCQERDTVRVTVDPPVVASAGRDTSICAGSSLQLHGTGGARYRWSPADDLSCDTCADPVATPKANATYRVIAWSRGGCVDTASVDVEVMPLPATSAGDDIVICIGAEPQLHASGAEKLTWRLNSSLSCLECAEPLVNPVQTTTYYVTGRNRNGCESTDSVTVKVIEKLEMEISSDTTICRGGSVRLGAHGATSYRWQPDPTLSCLDCSDPIARPTSTTTYHVTGSLGVGCHDSEAVTVTVVDPPRLELSGDSAICFGGNARLAVRGALSYRWSSSSSDPICIDCAEQLVSPGTTTTYRVVGTNQSGCSTIGSFTVRVLDKPTLTLLGGGAICPGESLALHATGAATYRWEPADGLSCNDCSDPIASPKGTTLYRVVGSSADGCLDTGSLTVAVNDIENVVASLPRDLRLLPGQVAPIELSLDRSFLCDTVELDLTWHGSILTIEEVRMVALLLADGWSGRTIDSTAERYHARFVRSSVGTIGPGAIVAMKAHAYLGDVTRSELTFTLRTNAGACISLSTRPGEVLIDSICGLSFRLIESSGVLKLEAPRPNRMTGPTSIRFSLPFDAEMSLTLYDIGGRTSRVLVDGYRQGGDYEALVQTRDLPDGLYLCRLRVGEMVLEEKFVVVK